MVLYIGHWTLLVRRARWGGTSMVMVKRKRDDRIGGGDSRGGEVVREKDDRISSDEN